jgi:predicted peptidase
VVVHVPLGWLVRHRFDNRARLAALKQRGGHVWIFHGANDEAIPVWMGRALAEELGPTATYREIGDGWHNDLLDKNGTEIMQTMREARDWK